MISQQCLQQFMHYVDSNPRLSGMGIGYSGEYTSRVLKQPNQAIPQGLRTWIVILEDGLPLPGGVQSQFSPQKEMQQMENISQNQSRWGSFLHEAPTFLLSCGSAAVTGGVSLAAGAAAPATGGLSTIITVVTWSGAAASAAQCGISIGRIANNLFWNDGRNEEFFDSEKWYKNTTDALDGIALLGDIVGLGQSARLIIQISRSSGKPISTLLRGYGRAERKRIARDLAKVFVDDYPKLFKQFVRAGKLPTVFAAKPIEKVVALQLWSAFAAALDVGGSVQDGLIKHVYIVGE